MKGSVSSCRIAMWLMAMILTTLSPVAAGPRDWATPFRTSPSLGRSSVTSRILYKGVTAKVSGDQYRAEYRWAILVGGTGRFATFHFPVPHSGADSFKPRPAFVIAPGGKMRKPPTSALSMRSVYEDEILYSEDYVSTWTLPDLEVGSIVILDYELVSEEKARIFEWSLQSSESAIDSCDIRVMVPPGFRVACQVLNGNRLDVVSDSHRVCARNVPEREAQLFDGNQAASLLRAVFQVKPGAEYPAESWADIAKRMVSLWNKRTKYDGEGKIIGGNIATGRDSLAAILAKYEKEFRYVAIELGEGRYVPHKPEDVAKLKYGDCKDLSLCLSDKLRQAGYRAWPILVHTRSHGRFYPDLPADHQFNHAIVAVVMESDTIYYDPTARGFDLGNLPWDDQGAYALWLAPHGLLCKLPLDSVPILFSRRFDGVMDNIGRLQGRITLQFDPRSNWPDRECKSAELEQLLRRQLKSQLGIDATQIVFDPDEHRLAALVTIRHSVETLGDKSYWTANPFKRLFPDSANSGSQSGYFFPRPQNVTDSVRVELPPGFRLPGIEPMELSLKEGKVSFIPHTEENIFRSASSCQFNAWHYPPESKANLDSLLYAIRTTNMYCLTLPVVK